MFYFLKKKSNKEHCERKKRNIYTYNMYSTNIEGQKIIWVPKVEKINCDAYMLDNLNS